MYCITVKELRDTLSDESRFQDDSLVLVVANPHENYKPVIGVISSNEDYSAILMCDKS